MPKRKSGISGQMGKYLRVIARLRGKYTVSRLFTTVMKSLCKRRTLGVIKTLEPLERKNDPPRYIVSLTSYCKRLRTAAPYSIASLLDQSVRPDRVVLWVGKNDRGRVPKVMERLIDKGLEIRYCEDMRSYTKLVPALETFPSDYIITADDDVFYPKNWLAELMETHRRNPGKIVCHRAHGITVGADHAPLPYDKWDAGVEPGAYLKDHSPHALFPTGVAGILYPPHSLAKDVTNKKLFMELAPMADDIWFWAMAVLNAERYGGDSPYAVVENSCTRNLWYVNAFEQLLGSALLTYNCAQGGNDRQLKAVLDFYPETLSFLKSLKPLKSLKAFGN